jgi:hypothetical protein
MACVIFVTSSHPKPTIDLRPHLALDTEKQMKASFAAALLIVSAAAMASGGTKSEGPGDFWQPAPPNNRLTCTVTVIEIEDCLVEAERQCVKVDGLDVNEYDIVCKKVTEQI